MNLAHNSKKFGFMCETMEILITELLLEDGEANFKKFYHTTSAFSLYSALKKDITTNYPFRLSKKDESINFVVDIDNKKFRFSVNDHSFNRWKEAVMYGGFQNEDKVPIMTRIFENIAYSWIVDGCLLHMQYFVDGPYKFSYNAFDNAIFITGESDNISHCKITPQEYLNFCYFKNRVPPENDVWKKCDCKEFFYILVRNPKSPSFTEISSNGIKKGSVNVFDSGHANYDRFFGTEEEMFSIVENENYYKVVNIDTDEIYDVKQTPVKRKISFTVK